MLKIKWKKSAVILGVLFAVTWMGNLVFSSKATEVENVQKEVQSKEEQLKQLNQEMKNTTDQIVKLTQEIGKIENEIQTKEVKLKQQKDVQARLYNDMKIRIQFMYENGSGSILEKMMESKSIADFINAVEYGNSITNYDRAMLKNYDKVCMQIVETQQDLKQKQQSIQVAKTECEKKQQLLSKSIITAKQELLLSTSELDQLIATAKANEEKLAKEIEKQQQQQWEESQKPKPSETQPGADGGNDNSGNQTEVPKDPEPGTGTQPSENVTDLNLLAALIECESLGEVYEGKLAVGSVVLNRVESSRFPNTIREVIYQSGQFAPASSGRLELVLLRGASSSCVSAAQEVLGGVRNVNCLFFKRNTGDKEGTIIGNHVFY